MSLVRAAEQRAAISQLQNFDTAVWQFRDKYDGLPGDARLIDFPEFVSRPGSSSAGDSDGVVEHFSGGLQCGEVVAFWSDLQRSEMIAGVADGLTSFQSSGSCYPDMLDPDTNLAAYFPKSKFKNSFVFLNSGLDTVSPDGPEIYGLGHSYILARSPISAYVGRYNRLGGTTLSDDQATIPALSAYNFDRKIDDGMPLTGKVRSADLGPYGVVQGQPMANKCYTGTEYNKLEENVQELCQLAVKAGF